MTLTSSTVSENNTAGQFSDGGGIYSGLDLTLTDSTISGNSTAGPDADGGGIYADSGVTLTNSTVTDNHADHGGGIWNYDDSIAIISSIVAGNTAGGGMNDIDPGTGSLLANYSLVEQTGLTIQGSNNVIGQPANLGPLADNGGPTETHALLASSLAIDVQLVDIQPPPTVVHEYDLNNSLADVLGGPDLVALGGVLTASGYAFGPNQGLNLSGALNDPAEYTIELHFSFDALSGYQKIIDFADLGSDFGLYTSDSDLLFYDANGATASNLFSQNTQHQVVLSRDETTDVVRVIVDGSEAFSFVDGFGIAVFSGPDQIMHFFQDDNVTGNTEAGSGFIDRIRIFDQVWNATTGFGQFDQRGAPFQRVVGAGIDSGAYERQAAADSSDFDGDLDVDGSDFLAWQRGFVDADELSVWQLQFGTVPPLAAVESLELSVEGSGLSDSSQPLLSSDLVDLALAVAWMNPTAIEDVPFIEDQQTLDEAARDSVFASGNIISLSRSATDSEVPTAASADEDGVDETELSEKLLELVFG